MQGYLQNRGGALSGPQASGPGIGALDPYAFKAAAHTAQGAEDHLATPPQKQGVMDHLGRILPVAGAALATGGLAIPFAAAFAAGSTAHQLQKERREQFEYEKNKNLAAGEIYGRASEQYRAGLPASASAAPKAIKWVETFDEEGKPVHRPTNALTGEPMGEDLPRDPRTRGTSEYEKVALDMFGKSFIDLPPDKQREIRQILETPSATRNRLHGNRADVLAGEENLAGAGERGKQEQQRRYQLMSVRDEIEIDFLPMLDETAAYAQEMLDKIEENPGSFSFPVFGSFLAAIDPDLAEMQAYAASEALQNLQITNLAPVTEKELEFIQTMAANPNAWNDEVNIRRLKTTLKKITRHKEKVARQMEYIRRQLGEPEPEAATPAVEPFDPDAYLDGE